MEKDWRALRSEDDQRRVANARQAGGTPVLAAAPECLERGGKRTSSLNPEPLVRTA